MSVLFKGFVFREIFENRSGCFKSLEIRLPTIKQQISWHTKSLVT